jgi:ABC-type polysaccharide/polyol phosphate transport system ATPase subunit
MDNQFESNVSLGADLPDANLRGKPAGLESTGRGRPRRLFNPDHWLVVLFKKSRRFRISGLRQINMQLNSLETVIHLDKVSVRYNLPEERVGTFKEYMIRLLQKRMKYNSFLALNEVNIDVKQGEIFGIVGRNGAGKSTLLKVISRVLVPTEGRVWIKGRVSPLLELGAGFHPELTGRENVFLNGTLLGHPRREIEDHMEEIIEFAELGAFMEAALRTYSSGMVARLGFAVATTWKPEILILDEVLSVGDEAFQLKCQKRMEAFRKDQVTTLIVTHSMQTVEALCTRAAWIDHGIVKAVGAPADIIQEYRHLA